VASSETGRPTFGDRRRPGGGVEVARLALLQNSPKVSDERREAVLAAVAELGYRPNAAARRLAERRSHSVDVLLNDIRQPWFADVLDAVTPVLHAHGKHMLLGDGRPTGRWTTR